ncbi:MAG: hypothetical protein FGM41_11530, partial [Bacteroidetes bacterium]|nr:hypothetical protein [Bacteroidota bacterium]
IYIQHRDKKGDYYNVELATAGHPGDGTIQTLTHTTTEAIKSGIALRSFDAKQSIGLCLVNLAKSYERKFGSKDDDYLLKCAELVLKHDPLNLNALLLKQQILDVRVTNFALENNISDINKLKANNRISETVNELENHLALLYRLGYRQMPYDMQEIIMTGIFPKDFKDKNPSPFTTIDPKDEHRKSFKTLYGGLFQEVFEIREFEPYGHYTFQTTTNKITVIDTTAQTGFLIDPVAFAYDFGARMYDARLGRWLSVDPKATVMPARSPYSAFMNNPIFWDDPDGQCPICPWLDAIVDVGFALYDVGEITYDYVTKGKVDPVSVAALTADLGSIFIPMATGAGLAVRAGVATTKGAVKTTTRIVVEKAKDVVIKSANDINKTFTKIPGKYAPFKAGTKVAEFTTEASEQFVRVFKEGSSSNAKGSWMMKKSDLLDSKGNMLSPKDIKDKFSLENVPDRIVDVEVPSNMRMRMGEAAGVDKLGTTGGGTQFQLIDDLDKVKISTPKQLKQ